MQRSHPARAIYAGLTMLIVVPSVLGVVLLVVGKAGQQRFAASTSRALQEGLACGTDASCMQRVATARDARLWLINPITAHVEIAALNKPSDRSDLGFPSVRDATALVNAHEAMRPNPAQRETVLVAAARGAAASCTSADDDQILRCEKALRSEDGSRILLVERIAPRAASRLQYVIWPMLALGALVVLLALGLAWHWVRRISQALTSAAIAATTTKQAHIDMLADLAHHIKGPLQRVRTALHQHTGIDPAGSSTEHGDAAIAEIDRSLTSLLAVARMEAGLPAAAFTVTAVEPWLAAVVESFPSTIVNQAGRSIALQLQPRRDVGASRAAMDVSAMTSALTQLIDNASEFAATSLVVSCEFKQARWAVFTVADDGPGVAPELKPHLFRRLVSRRVGGTGLGLAYVAAVAQAHGGQARYQKRGSGGAQFEIWLPLA